MSQSANDKKPIIFSDVDGTIYSNFSLKSDTKDDVCFAIDNGADFNICTGNPVEERMFLLSDTLKARYLIGSSGAQIYDLLSKKIIKSWAISFDSLKQLIELAKQIKCQVLFWDNEKYYYLTNDFSTVEKISSYHFVSKDKLMNTPKLYNNEFIEPVKIEFYSTESIEDESYAKKIYDHISRVGSVSMVQTSSNVEISPKDVNKGSAIKWLMENVYLNESIKDVMTIGDSNNDLSMMPITNYSYAMANSSQKLLDIAHFFTSAVEQNGLGEAILDYLYRVKNIVKKYMLHNFSNGKGEK
ncbi:HAD-IIB family hydrolase [Mycoplasma phocoeninasale]|uniref:HAD-IIB family hydrolase n=1 Tax=Mycoplasma phocoeninasale TaxID=2726117 RepID=A0A858U2C4_9MOLU|nr:HAD-IIB family hydrolase [Mycoplasma phocoeninasale]QJG66199.1 HAD-IIB family hydrolase [Mycoplasma phocoeninasale]